MAENMGRYQVPSSGAARRRKYKKGTTYLALMVRLLQDSPSKMLTFTQLMDKLTPFFPGDRVRNTIQYYLSFYSCFVKVRTDKPGSKNNYWRVDESQITEKMMRRHFKGRPTLDQLPELGSTEKDRPLHACTKVYSPKPAAPVTQKRHDVKFTGPFSIESLLNRDSSIRACPKSVLLSAVSNAPVRVEQQPWRAERAVVAKRCLSWDCPSVETHLVYQAADSYSMYNTTEGNTGHGLIGKGLIKRVRVCAEPLFLVNTRPSVPTHFISPDNCCVNNLVPAYPYSSHYSRL